MEKKLSLLMDKHDLYDRNKIKKFIKVNPENLNLNELSRIAELANTKRSKTAAYYTDKNTLKIIEKYLPDISKKTIKILEPSAGIGNFLEIIIEKYKNADKLIIDLNDIDSKSLEIIKELNKYKNIPHNVEINYFNHNFLTGNFQKKYDLVIGNPPFLKMSKKTGLSHYASIFNDNTTKNMASFFLQKSLKLGDKVVLIMPKYFLHNTDFRIARKKADNYQINHIIDFGEKGFKGVLIETIALFIDTKNKPNITTVYSVTKNIINKQKQLKITSDEFPSWIIYRNKFFDSIASKLTFNIFSVFRDRQITNKLLKNNGEIRVLKSRNINRDGTQIVNIKNYDKYINNSDLSNLSVKKYLNRDDVYLCPNMTYYPRVIRKPKGVVTNGSVAILENKSEFKIENKDLKFFSSPTFEEFYRIARNYSSRSLNIDSNSIIFFGLLNR